MPQRFLRPGITTSDAWNAVSFEAQSFYIRILTLVDDFGRCDARVAILHGLCFALRPDIALPKTTELRGELHSSGLVLVYSVAGKEYLQVTKWQERARSQSKYPEPSGGECQVDSKPQRTAAESCLHRHRTSPSPSPCAPLAVEDVQPESQFPTVEEVIANGLKVLAPADWCRTYHAKKCEQGTWLNGYGKLIDWRKQMVRWWNEDREKTKHGTHKQPNRGSTRNSGTANEGRSADYANVGKVT